MTTAETEGPAPLPVSQHEKNVLARLPCWLNGQPARIAGRTWAAALVIPVGGDCGTGYSWATVRLVMSTNRRFQR